RLAFQARDQGRTAGQVSLSAGRASRTLKAGRSALVDLLTEHASGIGICRPDREVQPRDLAAILGLNQHTSGARRVVLLAGETTESLAPAAGDVNRDAVERDPPLRIAVHPMDEHRVVKARRRKDSDEHEHSVARPRDEVLIALLPETPPRTILRE